MPRTIEEIVADVLTRSSTGNHIVLREERHVDGVRVVLTMGDVRDLAQEVRTMREALKTKRRDELIRVAAMLFKAMDSDSIASALSKARWLINAVDSEP